MKNTIFTICCALFCSFSARSQPEGSVPPKLSPLTKLILRDISAAPEKKTGSSGYIYKILNGKKYLSGLVKINNPALAREAFSEAGILVNTRAGDIWTVLVPENQLPAFCRMPGIAYIQLDEPLKPQLDAALKTTRTDSVHGGYGLPHPFTGKDVVVGIIDFGFDYGHPVFFDTAGTNYRIKKVWEPGSAGTPPSGYFYGNELTGSTAIQQAGTDDPHQNHGTAVAGIAAGSGYGSAGGKLKGVAYQSDIVLVGVRRDSLEEQWRQGSFTDFIDGINYIFNYASSVQKPSVVNISWGSHSGPHDGTSLFNQACDHLSGAGKLIVMSAGNEGEEKIHLSKTFLPADTVIQSYVTFSSDTLKKTWVDVWGDSSKTFCAKITLTNNGVQGNSTGYVCIDDQVHSFYLLAGNGTDTCFVDVMTSSSEFNNKPRITLNLHNKTDDTILVSLKGNDGKINAWNEYYYFGYKYGYSSSFEKLISPFAVSGNNASTVSDLGSAQSVLLVGAYASKVNFTNIDNQNLSYSGYVGANKLVPFSSRGPLADGRVKPDVTAPGLTLATASSSFDTRYTPAGLNKELVVSQTSFGGKDYYFAEFSGTSASSPMAAGITALMLEANPQLTPQQAWDIIRQTAIRDVHTGLIPAQGSNFWGFGKINAYAAVKAALQANSIYDFKGKKLDCALFPNPNKGLFQLAFTGDKAENLNVEIADLTGKVLKRENWQTSAGENFLSLHLKELSAGTYLVRVYNSEGSVQIKALVL